MPQFIRQNSMCVAACCFRKSKRKGKAHHDFILRKHEKEVYSHIYTCIYQLTFVTRVYLSQLVLLKLLTG